MQGNANIKELAVAAWRLEKWLENLNSDRKMAAKSALRSIKKYLAALNVEVMDPVGARFDPGLAIEVVNNEAPEAAEDELIIIETLTPYVYQNGELVQHARVIIGTAVKTAKKSCELAEEAGDTPTTCREPEDTAPDATDPTDGDEPSIGRNEIERMLKYAKIL